MKIMPSCRDITEHASDYLDHALSPWHRAGFRLHLLMCLYCRRHIKQLRLTVATVGRLPPDDPTAEAEEKQLEALLHALREGKTQGPTQD